MAKIALLLFTAAFCASVQSAPSLSDSLEEELDKLALDAVELNAQCKDTMELQFWYAESNIAAAHPDKKECLEKVKGPATIEESCYLADTIGPLMAAVYEAKATSKGRDPKEVLAELDYDNRKKKAINKFNGMFSGWVEGLLERFDACA